MPSVDVTALITGLNPARQASYTMPVLSPRHSSSTTITGSYRSTFSSSSIDRPYYGSSNSYVSPRINSYSERYTSRTYSTDDGNKVYSRHASITEDGITTRYREETREKSTRRDSLTRDSGYRDSSSRRDSLRDRDVSLTRGGESRNNLSTLSMIESVAELRSKYSPANYVPAVLRKQDISRSKSINDIGRPPLERVADATAKGGRAKKDVGAEAAAPPGSAACDSSASSSSSEADPKLADSSTDNSSSSMDVTEVPRINNHTTNFASYIPSKDYHPPDGNAAIVNAAAAAVVVDGEVPMNQTEDLDMDNNDTLPHFSYQHRILNANNDISTSPRLNRAAITQNASGSSSQSSAERNNAHVTQRSSPTLERERNRDDDRNYDRQFGSNPVRNQGLNGLKNIGNTCFMNSVIQCLSNTRYLLEYVKEDAYLEDINTSISSMKGALIKAFSQVIQELWSADSSDRVVNTVALKSQIQRFAPRFMGYAQQDAQEFLRYLLEGLHEDVNRVTSKPTPIITEIDEKLSDGQKAAESWQRYLRMDNSRVVDIFVGQLKSTLRCTHCGHCSVTFDPFWDLSLPIPQRQGPLRLGQCLEYFTREETLDGDEKPVNPSQTCSKCKERRKCTKSFSIQKFPKILVIHLKRFSPTERFRGKLNLVIDFPLQGLDLSPYAANKGHTTECMYNLYAISNHSGTTYSGHYTAYCKHPYTGQWHEYNDSRVSTISPKSVVSSEAYVLFYELVGQHAHL